MWFLKDAPTLVVIVPENSANSGDHNCGIPVSVRVLGDENRNLPGFCLPTLTRNPLGVPGRIIHRWKDIFKEITTPLRSRETVQYSRRNYGDKLTIMDLRGGIAPSFLSRPPGSLNVDERLPGTLPWTLTKGERIIIPFNIDVEIQIKPGHDKAASCFSYISPSTLWISVKFGTYRKVFSRRIQRRLLQEDWRRTR